MSQLRAWAVEFAEGGIADISRSFPPSKPGCMETRHSANCNCCLSLVDGFMGECELVRWHNQFVGASADELIEVPQEMKIEFRKLSSAIEKLGRAFELGLIK